MTAVVHEQTGVRPEPLRLPRIPWPAGTTFFAFRTWVALAIGFYAAFFLELDGASSTGVCILILAQPAQGMVLSKSVHRLLGTIVGVVSALILTSLFPQDRTMLVASFAVWMAILTAIASMLRDFRAYGCTLAGYTVAIVSIANIDAPGETFSVAINRVAAIVVGIAAIGFTNAFLATAESSASLISKLRAKLVQLRDLAEQALDTHAPLAPQQIVAMSSALMPLRSEISFATPELPNGRSRARGARSALLGLFELITAINAVGIGLDAVGERTQVTTQAVAIVRRALHLQDPSRCIGDLEALTTPRLADGSLSIEEAFVLDRMHFLVECLVNIRDGLRALRIGIEPRRRVALPVHQDYVAVVFNALRVLVAVALVSVAAIWSGLPETATAVLFTAVFVSLGSTQPNPMIMGRAALFGMPMVVLAGTLYAFFILPMLEGYPLFILSLAPLVVAMCWLIKIGMPGAGLIFGVQTLVLIGPANVQTIDPPSFVSTATMLAVSGAAIFMSFLLVLPVDPAQRRLRLALGVGTNLRKALADEGRLAQPRASLHYDRLSQFSTWQGRAVPSLARQKTMRRLVDLGHLSYAVRRSWRALDRARPLIDAEIDAQARRLLPSLSPEETEAMAEIYLAAARGKDGREALALAHAAAALHGTAYVTTTEKRLLQHVELLRRKL